MSSAAMDKRASRSYGTGSISLPASGGSSPSFFYDEFSSVQSRTFLKWCACATTMHDTRTMILILLCYAMLRQAEHAPRGLKHTTDEGPLARLERRRALVSAHGPSASK